MITVGHAKTATIADWTQTDIDELIALGKVPGLAIDRVGIALLGAIGMVAAGVITTERAVEAVDIPTVLLLYSLMVVSAQLRLGGFYSWAASELVRLLDRPRLFLLTGRLMSALL